MFRFGSRMCAAIALDLTPTKTHVRAGPGHVVTGQSIFGIIINNLSSEKSFGGSARGCSACTGELYTHSVVYTGIKVWRLRKRASTATIQRRRRRRRLLIIINIKILCATREFDGRKSLFKPAPTGLAPAPAITPIMHGRRDLIVVVVVVVVCFFGTGSVV